MSLSYFSSETIRLLAQQADSPAHQCYAKTLWEKSETYINFIKIRENAGACFQ